ncbi:fructose-2,6-bisphosphatase TIGAR B isoform X2 [Neoarius graeffei]|uniref:fructose-2,6-bisphosphatase TIGAR B isoform X2 n=1 Tax=Neoarius graeffei TaxID=443677 RepID=UPI00298D03FC|nr:fructose-2,6-bisphosphatase TIGAR B isoform X2 [Neoarius graeffei]
MKIRKCGVCAGFIFLVGRVCGLFIMLTFGLTLIRHGETQYNKDRLLQETGLWQAEAAGRYLQDLCFTNVFVSNLQRAIQTAEIILKSNVHSAGIEMVLDPLLRERGFGMAEGRPKEDLKKMANAAGQACRDFTPPGGESLEQVKTRFCKFLKSMFQRMLTDHCLSPYPSSSPEFPESSLPTVAGLTNDGVENLRAHALVVSHGAFIRVAVRHLVDGLHCSLPEGLKMSQVYSACPNTGICRFVITLQMEQDVPRPIALHCIFINRKDHLISLKD